MTWAERAALRREILLRRDREQRRQRLATECWRSKRREGRLGKAIYTACHSNSAAWGWKQPSALSWCQRWVGWDGEKFGGDVLCQIVTGILIGGKLVYFRLHNTLASSCKIGRPPFKG